MIARTNAVPDLARCCSICDRDTDTPDLDACLLEPAGQRGRLATIRDVARRSNLWSERSRLSLRAGYSLSEESALRTLIEAEAARCPFLRFELRTIDGELVLSVSAPKHAREAAWEIFDALQATDTTGTT